MSYIKLIENLNRIQEHLTTIFKLLDIPFLEKNEDIKPINTKKVDFNKSKILRLIENIIEILKKVKLEKIVRISDFCKFLEKITQILNNLISYIKNFQKKGYNQFYLLIQMYWYIEYFKKHEIEFKNNELFNESVHYKWIVDDTCLEFLTSIQDNPKSSFNKINEIDSSRLNTLIETNLIKIENEKIELTSLGNIMVDLAKIGDIYIYYIDEFNELFEELKK
ncbi:MAG: hypothetical protein ACTSRG_10160 [Candidatus Helarchaeota archaeon]